MAKWIMVVDDDTSNLKMAGNILSKNNMRVTALKSGRALLDYISEKVHRILFFWISRCQKWMDLKH